MLLNRDLTWKLFSRLSSVHRKQVTARANPAPANFLHSSFLNASPILTSLKPQGEWQPKSLKLKDGQECLLLFTGPDLVPRTYAGLPTATSNSSCRSNTFFSASASTHAHKNKIIKKKKRVWHSLEKAGLALTVHKKRPKTQMRLIQVFLVLLCLDFIAIGIWALKGFKWGELPRSLCYIENGLYWDKNRC